MASPLRKLSRFIKMGLFLALILALYAGMGFYLIPEIIKAKLPPTVEEATGRKTSLSHVKFNPFVFTFSLHGFELQEKNGKPFARFEELFVDFDVKASISEWALMFGDLRLSRPHVQISIGKNGKLNFSDLLALGAKKPGSKPLEIPPLRIARIQLEAGRVDFTDVSGGKPFNASLSTVDVKIEKFDSAAGHKMPYQLQLTLTPKEGIEAKGELSINPVRSNGHVSFKGISTRKFWEYFHDKVRFEVQDGSLFAKAAYRFDMAGKKAKFVLSGGQLKLDSVKIAESGEGQVLIDIPLLSLEEIGFDLAAQRFSVGNVISRNGHLKTWLNEDGSFNYAALFAAPEAAGNPATKAAEKTGSSSWKVHIAKADISDYAIEFEDRTREQPVALQFTSTALTITPISLEPGAKMQVDFKTETNDIGRLELAGTTVFEPLQADFKVTASEVGLTAFRSYLEDLVRLDLVSGQLDVAGDFSYGGAEGNSPKARFTGTIGVTDFSTKDKEQGLEIINWRSLVLSQLQFDFAPNRLRIDEIVADAPYARIIIEPDQTVNVSKLVVKKEDAGDETAADQREQGMPIEIDRVRIENGTAFFADQTLQPAFSTGIQGLHGGIKGLTTEKSQRAVVSLEGKVDKYAPVKIWGEINPFSASKYSDIKLQFSNLDLTRYSPYSGKFAGYRIEKGKMKVDLEYKLSDRKLKAENNIILDRLTLGERVESPRATSLPLRLAVALLKDSSGRIDIDLPLRGNLDDPEFSITGLVYKAFVQLITKVVSSPFKLLGAVLGGWGEELGYVDFSPGSAEIEADQQKKLNDLAKGLRERPALQLEIRGYADPKRDRLALAEQALERQLRLIKQSELKASSVPAPEIPSLSAEDYQRLVLSIYRGTFPDDAGKFPSGEAVPEESFKAAKMRLLRNWSIGDVDLRLLAQERNRNLRDYLVKEGGVAADRVYLVGVKIKSSKGNAVRTVLSLTAS